MSRYCNICAWSLPRGHGFVSEDGAKLTCPDAKRNCRTRVEYRDGKKKFSLDRERTIKRCILCGSMMEFHCVESEDGFHVYTER